MKLQKILASAITFGLILAGTTTAYANTYTFIAPTATGASISASMPIILEDENSDHVDSVHISYEQYSSLGDSGMPVENVVITELATRYRLNLRTGASTNDSVIMVLPERATVNVLDYQPDGFSLVSFNGTVGYAFTYFLGPVVPQVSIASITPAFRSNTITDIHNVELLSWNEVRSILPQNTRIQVLDIGTGLTYYVRNFSNGRHADVETITQADTDIFFQSFGRRWTWDVRPILVTFDDNTGRSRTVAAAIHGMPHDVQTIHNNGMNGHVCIHFLGVVNRNPIFERDMQAAVMQAYLAFN